MAEAAAWTPAAAEMLDKKDASHTKDVSCSREQATALTPALAGTPAAAEMSKEKDASHSKDVSCGRAEAKAWTPA